MYKINLNHILHVGFSLIIKLDESIMNKLYFILISELILILN